MAFAFVRRTANRTGFATPDKNHLHHRLLRLGHGHRRSVLILWAWTALLSGFVLFPLYISSVNAIIPFGVLALGVVLFTLFHPGLRRRSAMEADEEPLPPEDPAPAIDGSGPGAAAAAAAPAVAGDTADQGRGPSGTQAPVGLPGVSGEL
jgi:UDP-GlcNAc:undecaprenyl-phosphate GlcNAc-1-phosphate transferase